MVLLLKFYKIWTKQTIFDAAITTNNIIITIILPVVKLGVTKPLATIWYIHHTKNKECEVLKWTS